MSKTPETSSGSAEGLAGSLTGLELARLVECSEARAYESLFQSAHRADPGLGFGTSTSGSAVLLRATAVTTTLVVNRVLGLGVSEPATEQHVQDALAFFGQGRGPFGVELSPSAEPAHLASMLRAHRLRKSLSAQVLYRDASAPPPRYAAWTKATGLRVEAVESEKAAVVAALCCENFNMPELVGQLLRLGSGAPGWRRWLAFDGATPVGASLSYVSGGVAWLGWTSAKASHRGRWVHAGIVARQLEDAHAAGCQWITTETAVSTKEKPDAAYHNLRNFGFRDAYLRSFHIYQPPRNA